jgi:hypothetical protein
MPATPPLRSLPNPISRSRLKVGALRTESIRQLIRASFRESEIAKLGEIRQTSFDCRREVVLVGAVGPIALASYKAVQSGVIQFVVTSLPVVQELAHPSVELILVTVHHEMHHLMDDEIPGLRPRRRPVPTLAAAGSVGGSAQAEVHSGRALGRRIRVDRQDALTLGSVPVSGRC